MRRSAAVRTSDSLVAAMRRRTRRHSGVSAFVGSLWLAWASMIASRASPFSFGLVWTKEWRARRSKRANGVGETFRTESVIRRMEVAPGAIGAALTSFGGYLDCFNSVDRDNGRAAEICPGVGEILLKYARNRCSVAFAALRG